MLRDTDKRLLLKLLLTASLTRAKQKPGQRERSEEKERAIIVFLAPGIGCSGAQSFSFSRPLLLIHKLSGAEVSGSLSFPCEPLIITLGAFSLVLFSPRKIPAAAQEKNW